MRQLFIAVCILASALMAACSNAQAIGSDVPTPEEAQKLLVEQGYAEKVTPIWMLDGGVQVSKLTDDRIKVIYPYRTRPIKMVRPYKRMLCETIMMRTTSGKWVAEGPPMEKCWDQPTLVDPNKEE